MATIKFANGKEYALAATPEFSNGIGNVLITPSDTVTAEAVRVEVSDYNNTKSFTIDGGSAITYYYLSDNVSLDRSGNIIVPLRQKTASEQQSDAQAEELSNVKTMFALLQLAIAKKLNGGI